MTQTVLQGNLMGVSTYDGLRHDSSHCLALLHCHNNDIVQ